MGRHNKNYQKDLHQQAYDKLTSMLSFGESKQNDMKNGTSGEKIYSYKTYTTYWTCIKRFLRYVQKEHPDCTTVKHARAYVSEYLERQENATTFKNGKEVPKFSAWTIHTESAALRKLYHINPGDNNYYHPPVRRREDITRSRIDAIRDKHFSKTNNKELIDFCRATGLRREGLSKIKGDCLYDRSEIESKLHALEQKENLTDADKKDLRALRSTRCFVHQNYFVRVTEKGGKTRYAPIIGPHEQQVIERIKNTPADKKVWQHVHSCCDVHSYRGDYATMLYKEYARDLEKIPYDRTNKGSGKKYRSDLYCCRGDEKGKELDRRALKIVSLALGHGKNRESVVADNYLRNL